MPRISEGKLGTVNFLDEKSKSLTIELRDDFKVKDKKSEEALKSVFSDKYFGQGVYQLTFPDMIQGAWLKVDEDEKEVITLLLSSIKPLISKQGQNPENHEVKAIS